MTILKLMLAKCHGVGGGSFSQGLVTPWCLVVVNMVIITSKSIYFEKSHKCLLVAKGSNLSTVHKHKLIKS